MYYQEQTDCDECSDFFSIYEMKIFSTEVEEDRCSPFIEMKTLCKKCYEKYNNEHREKRCET